MDDSSSDDESLEAQIDRIIKKRKDVNKKYLVDGNRFKYVEPDSEDTTGSVSS